jgi:hypothetical protein
MGGSAGGCREHAPLRIEPEVGQSPENLGQTVSNKPWDVLQEDESWLHVANDVFNEGPEPPLVFDPELVAGNGEGLTRDARRNDIHDTTPYPAAERSKVAPDRSRIHPPFRHARSQYCGRISLPLDVTDRAKARDGSLESEGDAANAGTYSQLIHPLLR